MVLTNLKWFISLFGSLQANGVYHPYFRRTMIHSDHPYFGRTMIHSDHDRDVIDG